jgi:hypothetical protein
MGVDNIRLQLPQMFFYLVVARNIIDGIYGPDESIDHYYFVVLSLCLLEKLSLRPYRRPRD